VLETVERAVRGSVDEASSVEGRVVVEAGAEVIRSVIRGPAVIGSDTRIVDSFVGPFTAISSGCEVIHSEIEHSVVLSGSRIIDVPRLVDSLLGHEVEVTRSASRPVATRLMIGDHCLVDLA
jgi:glucose-1-phosphate thymidylyltransferase